MMSSDGESTPAGEHDALAAQREAIVAALRAWSDAAGHEWKGPFAAFWHAYTGMPLFGAKYSSYFGTKDVWTVVVQHPEHQARRSRKAK